MTKVTIDPITRLEGHGRIEIFLNDAGDVDRAYFVVPELRGFEKFAVGRRAEDMPQITSRICGVCPTAHHMCSTKTLDDLFHVEPPPAAKKLREMLYNIFMLEDHALHFYFLGGPDFIVGPKAPKAERNILGVIGKVGVDVAGQVIAMRKELRELIAYLGGKVVHPVFGLPGGVAKGIKKEDQERFVKAAEQGVDFALFTLKAFHDLVLSNKEYVDLILSDAYTHRTYYMGLVDDQNRVNFYDGMLRVADPNGKEYARFDVRDYVQHMAEHVEPWTYVKFMFLRNVGWNGFEDGEGSGIYSVAPLARLNAADGMATPKAQEAYEEYVSTLGGKPVHQTLANHWARIVEMVYAAERFLELARDPEITSDDIRRVPTETPTTGIGVVEAPRGTLVHHYETDERGVLTRANLIVATQGNSARMAMSVDKAAKALIHNGNVDDGLLNMVEMAFRAYDPCHACATHALPGQMPLLLSLRDSKGNILKEIPRGG
ncbi:MAG: Ni/Fe hydrogenase subunit alpha [Dehalococcoidia bacterium]|nr:Ni/Fe hydrogenase subunit alpha [Dehalococcoidia bacterium]